MGIFGIKNKRKEERKEAYKLDMIHQDLEDEAYLQYNTKYDDLGEKEKLEIAEKVYKKFKYRL